MRRPQSRRKLEQSNERWGVYGRDGFECSRELASQDADAGGDSVKSSYRAMLRENSTQQRGSSLDRVEVNSTITSIRFKEKRMPERYASLKW